MWTRTVLFFSTSLEDSLEDTEAVFIAVGTPPDEDGIVPICSMYWEWQREIGHAYAPNTWW
jgi:UDP-glucose 6-dehydrogenase